MAQRKTLSVAALKEEANRQLARTDVTPDFRRGVAALLEHFLMETDNYGGFNDVHWSQEGGYQAWLDAGSPDFPEKSRYFSSNGDGTDDYRRVYY